MGLSSQQRKQLQLALIDAFPSQTSLERLLDNELDKSLRVIASEGSLQDIVFRLIQTANAEGWVEDLVCTACQSNPGNTKLRDVAQELIPNYLESSSKFSLNIPSDQSGNSEDAPSAQSQQQQKILILGAHSKTVDLEKEIQEIKETIQRADQQTLFEIIIKSSVYSLDIIDDAIQEECPQIVHLCGQGNKDGNLVLKDDRENDNVVSLESLADLFEKHSGYVNCVLIYATSYSSKAAKLISKYINYAIGIQKSIDKKESDKTKQELDETKALRKFIQNFYKTLTYTPSNQPDVIYQAFEAGCHKSQLEYPQYTSTPILRTKTQLEYYQCLINSYQRYQTEGLSQNYALDLPEIFVPLKVEQNYYNNTRSELIWQGIDRASNNNEREGEIWDFLAPLSVGRHVCKCIVLVGGPGAGKSTLLKHLTLIYANEVQQKYYSQAPEIIPVLLLIRNVYQEIVNNENTSLENLINEQVQQIIQEKKKIQPVFQWLLKEISKQKNNKCLIMLDGLDEVADEIQRQQVSTWIDKQISKYPNTTFILTSRPGGYKAIILKNVRIVLEIQQLKQEQVLQFIHQWYLEVKKKTKKGKDENSKIEKQSQQQAEDLISKIRNNSALAAMAVNPLLLTMISTVHDQLNLKNKALPEQRVELYKEMCEVLLEKRQKEKNISDQLTGKDKQFVLQVLALKLMQQMASEQQTATEFKLSQGISWIQEPLAVKVSNEVQPRQFIEYIRDISGLLVEKELKYYQFAHLSFQEYLAATQISELNQDLLISEINKSWWAETIRLYAAQSDATELIREILKIQSPSVNVMALAYNCLEESPRVNGDVRRELLQRLEDGLESTDPEIFKLAVQVSLIKRFRNFSRISEELEIDMSYITYAEYQLFLDETGESRQPQHWERKRFFPGDAKKTITGISWKNALRFCAWLGEWYRTRLGNQLSEMAVHYRLPKEEEIDINSINDDKRFSESGILVVKFQLPSRYSKLADYLWKRKWKEADEETADLMLQVSKKKNEGYLTSEDIRNFPCDDLRLIDYMWVYASKEHFGFSVQKNIYQSLGGTSEYNDKVWINFGDRVGWRMNGSWINYGEVTLTQAPQGHLPWDTSRRKPWIAPYYSLASKLVNCNL